MFASFVSLGKAHEKRDHFSRNGTGLFILAILVVFMVLAVFGLAAPAVVDPHPLLGMLAHKALNDRRVGADQILDGFIALKVWRRDEPEPDAWSIEVIDPCPNVEGSPGLYGYSKGTSAAKPGATIYYDNYRVTRND